MPAKKNGKKQRAQNRVPQQPRRARQAPKKVRARVRAQVGKNFEDRLIRSLVLPADFRCTRMPCVTPTTTATFTFEQVTTHDIPSAQGTAYLIFNDPIYPLWRSYVGSITGGILAGFTYSSTSTYAVPLLPQLAGESIPLNWRGTDVTSWAVIGTPGLPSWSFSLPIVGSSKDSTTQWVYVPNGMMPTVRVMVASATTAGSAYNIVMEYSSDGTEENAVARTYETTVTATSIELLAATDVSFGGWYRPVSLTCRVAPTTTTGATLSTTYMGWLSGGTVATPTAATMTAWLPVSNIGSPEVTQAPAIYSRCRLNAGSFLFQNVTAVLNKEGSVRAGVLKLRNRVVWVEPDAAADYWGDLQPKLRYTERLEKGLYTYLQPQMSTLSGNGFGDYYYGTGSAAGQVMGLGYLSTVYYIEFRPAAQSQTLQITYVSHHECENDSMLFPVGQCQMPLEQYRQAMIAVQDLKPFVENPIHFAALMGAAKKMANVAWQRMRPYANPFAHRAVDWLIPRYQDLSIKSGPTDPYRD